MAGDKKFTGPGTPLVDLEQAWRDRLADAKALFDADRHAAAMASGLYALEINLKVRICRRLDLESLPKVFEIHDLSALLTMSGLSRTITATDSVTLNVKKNWDDIAPLSGSLNDLRYQPDARWTKAQVQAFFDQLEAPPHGVLAWLSIQP